MIIYADNIPEKWLGQTFTVLDQEKKPHYVKVERIVNSNALLTNGPAGVDYFNVQAFALGLLIGSIRMESELFPMKSV